MRWLPALLGLLLSPVAIAAPQPLASGTAATISRLERLWEAQYEEHFGIDRADALAPEEIAARLERQATQHGRRAALIYLAPQRDRLEIVVVSPGGEPIVAEVPVSGERLAAEITAFTRALQYPVDPIRIGRDDYLAPSQQLYRWTIAPVVEELRARDIDILLLCTGPGLRSLPFAALHDGEKFLVEEFAPTRIAAFSLTQFDGSVLDDAAVLAMGASEFAAQVPLPSVPVEVRLAASGPRDGWLLDRHFTRGRLRGVLALQHFDVVHLATHAEFRPGDPSASYIQLWDTRLGLDAIDDLGLDRAGVELLVLSACKTAVGDREAELGFAGLAYQAGVGAAVASLWSVDDSGTLALMSEFYAQLRRQSVKAEALQQAQVGMLRGEVRVEAGVLRRGGTRGAGFVLPPAIARNNADFTHPFYWAAFSLIGNPW